MNKLKQIWIATVATLRSIDDVVQMQAKIVRLERDAQQLRSVIERLTTQLCAAGSSERLYRREALEAERTLSAIKYHIHMSPDLNRQSILRFFEGRKA